MSGGHGACHRRVTGPTHTITQHRRPPPKKNSISPSCSPWPRRPAPASATTRPTRRRARPRSRRPPRDLADDLADDLAGDVCTDLDCGPGRGAHRSAGDHRAYFSWCRARIGSVRSRFIRRGGRCRRRGDCGRARASFAAARMLIVLLSAPAPLPCVSFLLFTPLLSISLASSLSLLAWLFFFRGFLERPLLLANCKHRAAGPPPLSVRLCVSSPNQQLPFTLFSNMQTACCAFAVAAMGNRAIRTLLRSSLYTQTVQTYCDVP
jgi:hypothetical protein